MRKFFALVAVLLPLFAACSDSSGPLGVASHGDATADARGGPPAGKGPPNRTAPLLLTPSDLALKVGDRAQLDVERIQRGPGKTALKAMARWESSNPRVARVDRRGNVTAVAKGSAIITARTRAHGTGQATVTVRARTAQEPPPPPPPTVPQNIGPVTAGHALTLAEDESVLLLLSATDADDDALEFTVNVPAHGSIELVNDTECDDTTPVTCTQAVRYTPNANYFGTDAFTFSVTDDSLTAAAAVALTITPVNDAPTARPDTVLATGASSFLIDVLANDDDVDGDTLRIVSVSQLPGHIATAAIEDGKIRFTAVSESQSFLLTYVITDGEARVTAQIVISRNNTAPVAKPDAYSLRPNRSVLLDVMANDSDADGDALHIVEFHAGLAAPNHGGSLSVVDGQIRYTPKTGFIGVETFQYQVSDGFASAVSTVTVTMANVAPVANDEYVTVALFSSQAVINAIANDTDADGDSIWISSVGTPNAGGSASLVEGTIRYTPAGNTHHLESIPYTITDGIASASAHVRVTVANQLSPQVAQRLASGHTLLAVSEWLRVTHALSAANAFQVIRVANGAPDPRTVLAAVCKDFGLDGDPAPGGSGPIAGRGCMQLAIAAGMSAENAVPCS